MYVLVCIYGIYLHLYINTADSFHHTKRPRFLHRNIYKASTLMSASALRALEAMVQEIENRKMDPRRNGSPQKKVTTWRTIPGIVSSKDQPYLQTMERPFVRGTTRSLGDLRSAWLDDPPSRWSFQRFFIFTPILAEDEPIFTHILHTGGPTTN